PPPRRASARAGPCPGPPPFPRAAAPWVFLVVASCPPRPGSGCPPPWGGVPHGPVRQYPIASVLSAPIAVFRGPCLCYHAATGDDAMARTKKSDPDDDSIKPICRNKRAFHEYDVGDRLECGIVLTGTEVKSLRWGGA